MTGAPGPPVVVAVDGSGGGALDWAAAEAAATDSPLRVVHVCRDSAATDPSRPVPGAGGAPALPATEVLETAMARAAVVAPALDITGRTVRGGAVPVLAQQSRNARLLVLGARSPGRPRRFLRRPTTGAPAVRLAASAGCPVTVVGVLSTETDPPAPRVVVGVDATAASVAALGVALGAARRRGIPLTAVHAWSADRPADLEGVHGCPVDTEVAAVRLVDRMLAFWRPLYAEVPVAAEVVCADPGAALVAASRGAALLVVGSSGPRLGAVLDPVCRGLVARSPCPLTIVGDEGRGRTAARSRVRRDWVG